MHDKSKITYINGVVQSRGIILFTETGSIRKYLVIKSKIGGHFTFAKGHLLKGESEIECAKREILEEIGISEIEIIPEFSTTIRYEAYGEEKDVTFYLGKVKDEFVKIDDVEVSEARWLPFKEAYELITHDRTKKPLQDAEDFLNKK